MEDGAGKARHQGTGGSSRIHGQKEVPAGLEGEGPIGKPPDVPTEEGPDPATGHPPGPGQSSFLRQESPNPPGAPQVLGQKLSGLEESLFRVGASEHEVEKVKGLLVGDSRLLLYLVPEETDLLIHDIAQPETPRHRPGRVLRRQDLCREIQSPDHLEKG